MKTGKLLLTIIGAAMTITGIGGVPIYIVEKDMLRVGFYTVLLIAGIFVLGKASED